MEFANVPSMNFIDRSQPDGEFFDAVSSMVNFLEMDVNYATHVLDWLRLKVGSELSDQLLLLLLRETVDIVDAVSILVSKYSHRGAVTLCRSLFEYTLSIKYLCEDNRQLKAECYQYDKLKDELSACNRVIKSYSEIDTVEEYARDTVKENYQRCLDTKKIIEERIDSDSVFSEIDKEFKRTVRKGLQYPSWYTLYDGPKSVGALA